MVPVPADTKESNPPSESISNSHSPEVLLVTLIPTESLLPQSRDEVTIATSADPLVTFHKVRISDVPIKLTPTAYPSTVDELRSVSFAVRYTQNLFELEGSHDPLAKLNCHEIF